jgi:transcriptional regulator GlxA family with amidase domain
LYFLAFLVVNALMQNGGSSSGTSFGPSSGATKFAFILIPNFSLIAFTATVESLRLANRSANKELYTWHAFSVDGAAVEASDGFKISVDGNLDAAKDFKVVVVCGGVEIHRFKDKGLFSWLRHMARKGSRIGAVCTGSDILARAGLLDGYRCTIHWENLASFAENYPDIDVTAELFEIDRNRFTCSGGTATIDMMLNIISRQHGAELAVQVADQLLHERIRGQHDQQRMSLPARLGVRHSKLLAVIQEMENNLEEPLPRAKLAKEVGLSTRQLERLFQKYLKRSPARFYLELRLSRARLLLLQTKMSIIDVALACGFVSASHFSKCYRDYFGRTPRQERYLPNIVQTESFGEMASL